MSELATREITVVYPDRAETVPFPVPTKFTPEVRRIIIESVRAGNYYSTAFAKAGIASNTFTRWKRKGEIGPGEPGYDPDFHDFYCELQKAEAEAEARMVKTWVDAGEEDWQAASRFLSARHPERWAPKSKTELTGQNGGPIEFTIHLDTNANLGPDDADDQV